MSSSDLKTGSMGWAIFKMILYWVAGIGVVFFVLFLITFEKDGDENDDFVFQDGMPMEFFESHAFTESDEESLESSGIMEVPDVVKKEGKKDTAAKPVEKIKYVYIEKKPTPKAAELFEFETAPDTRVSDLINRKRREFSDPNDLHSQSEALNKDQDWTAYGQIKTQASYPVNLDRVITADRNIPCILVEEIISELAGKITCVIENNVFGAHGRFILLPAGSKAVGEYFPLTRTGDSRLVSTWHRIITPEGINVSFPKNSAAMTDAMGRAGLTGDVNNQYFEKYGIAVLVATLNTALMVSIPVETANQQVVVQNYSAELGRVSSAILQDNIDISPIVTINAGSRIFITPTEDIWFKESEGNNQIVSYLGE